MRWNAVCFFPSLILSCFAAFLRSAASSATIDPSLAFANRIAPNSDEIHTGFFEGAQQMRPLARLVGNNHTSFTISGPFVNGSLPSVYCAFHHGAEGAKKCRTPINRGWPPARPAECLAGGLAGRQGGSSWHAEGQSEFYGGGRLPFFSRLCAGWRSFPLGSLSAPRSPRLSAGLGA